MTRKCVPVRIGLPCTIIGGVIAPLVYVFYSWLLGAALFGACLAALKANQKEA